MATAMATASDGDAAADSSGRIDVCMTVEHDNKLAETIRENHATLGATSRYLPIDGVDFVDYPFNDGGTWSEHLQAVARAEPRIAVAPDIEPGDDVGRRLEQAYTLAQYADVVIVVPKAIHPSDVPDRFRIGIPMQSDWGSGAPWSMWAYRGREVHLLGGSPAVQLTAFDYVDVASVDTNSILKAAQFGDVWTRDGWEEKSDRSYYERIDESYANYWTVLNDG